MFKKKLKTKASEPPRVKATGLWQPACGSAEGLRVSCWKLRGSGSLQGQWQSSGGQGTWQRQICSFLQFPLLIFFPLTLNCLHYPKPKLGQEVQFGVLLMLRNFQPLWGKHYSEKRKAIGKRWCHCWKQVPPCRRRHHLCTEGSSSLWTSVLWTVPGT